MRKTSSRAGEGKWVEDGGKGVVVAKEGWERLSAIRIEDIIEQIEKHESEALSKLQAQNVVEEEDEQDDPYSLNNAMLALKLMGGRDHAHREGCSSLHSKNELFNIQHSYLRNIIERYFGVCKKCFKLLKGSMPNFKMTMQIDIVIAYYALHNFKEMNCHMTKYLQKSKNEMNLEGENIIPLIPHIQPLKVPQAVVVQWKAVRNDVVNGMWDAYQARRP
ncbi:hypothetical protein ACH5RR_039595 [Cinchona calisaya]|uniref:DDE Tnp4 domain-containing protein n=1 Tax=Cinchona calisaya TaxID=153742 RepID=A0ABD2XYP8_9GENT